jgi:hypothetical protein
MQELINIVVDYFIIMIICDRILAIGWYFFIFVSDCSLYGSLLKILILSHLFPAQRSIHITQSKKGQE